MSPLRLGLLGGEGRMGREVRKLVGDGYAGRFALTASPARGEALAPLLACDAVIDFSAPEAMAALAQAAAMAPAPRLPVFAVGSTGWTEEARRPLEALALRAPVLVASNFSLGAQALIALVKQWAPVFARLGFAPSILETHHAHKKDKPSGTALSLAAAILPGSPEDVPAESRREGEVIGDHSVTFGSDGETLTLSHHAKNRRIFAQGALEAAAWLHAERGGAARPGKLLGMDAYFKK